MTTQRTTLHGHKATRRIKWFNPKEIWEKDGKKYINIFAVVVVDACGFELLAVTSQIGIDRRGRHVLPDNTVVPKGGRFEYGGRTEHTSSIYAIGAPVGQLEEAGRELVAGLNKLTVKDLWQPPIGVKHGEFQIPSPEFIRTPI